MSARLMIVGAPGAGKGTQAAAICERYSIPQISTGDLFRAHAAAADDLGTLAASYTNRGELVPDEITNAMVAERLDEEDAADGFLLDGYPRNLAQVEALDAMLAERSVKLDAVIELDVPDSDVVGRLLERARIQGRADDTEEVIAHRIELYHAQTKPLTDVYRDRGILVRVDGTGTIDEVRTRLLTALSEFTGQ